MFSLWTFGIPIRGLKGYLKIISVFEEFSQWEDFDKPKICYSETNNSSETKIAFDDKSYMTDKTCFILLTKDERTLKHIYKIMCSPVFTWFMRNKSPLLGSAGISMTKDTVDTFPMAKVSNNSWQQDYNLSTDEMAFIESQI